MIGQTLAMLLPSYVWTGNPANPAYTQETLRNFLLRIKYELLWPRILVRHAPPPGEIQPNAPDRLP